MTLAAKLFIFGMAWAALAGWATAQAQTAPAPAPTAASDPAAAIKVANTGKRPIVALYTSPPGRQDWSDDMLGKGTLKPGQSLTLKFKAKQADCKIDFSALLDNGDTTTRPGIDLCAGEPSVGF
jgi:P pilus assembly chaperone PapD